MSDTLKAMKAEHTIIELARIVVNQENMIAYLNGEIEEQRKKHKELKKELERLMLDKEETDA